MPLIVPCPCGKRLRAREDLAGKRVRCPACVAIVQVPGVAPVAAASPVARGVTPSWLLDNATAV